MDVPRVLAAARVGLPALLSAMALGCGSSSISVDAPTTVKCQVNATTALSSAPAGGASGSVTVSATRDCTWSATSSTSWITIISPASGQGSGKVDFRVASNGDHATRQGTIAVNDTQLAIAQDAAPCRYSVMPASSSVDAAGGTVSADLSAPGGCTWTAVSRAAWLGVNASGNGSGRIAIAVARNAGEARTGTVTVADQTVTVVQAAAAPRPPTPSAPTPPPAPSCSSTIAPTDQSFSAKGGSGTIHVSAGDGCAWAAVSHDSWIEVKAGAAGLGDGKVSYSVAKLPQSGGDTSPDQNSRVGTIAVAGQTFTVKQSGG